MSGKTLREIVGRAHRACYYAGFPFVLLCTPLFRLHCWMFERQYAANNRRIRSLAKETGE